MGRELTGGPEGLPPVSSGPVAVGAHVSAAPPDPEQHCYVQWPWGLSCQSATPPTCPPSWDRSTGVTQGGQTICSTAREATWSAWSWSCSQVGLRILALGLNRPSHPFLPQLDVHKHPPRRAPPHHMVETNRTHVSYRQAVCHWEDIPN